MIAGYDIYGNPKSVSKMRQKLQKALEAGKRGEGCTVEELRKKSEEWLTHTKH